MQRVVDLIRLLVRATDKPPRLEMNNLTTITMMATLPLKAVQPPSYHGISNSLLGLGNNPALRATSAGAASFGATARDPGAAPVTFPVSRASSPPPNSLADPREDISEVYWGG
ncbi:hypothetical protein CIB48_g12305 [Xylaria polymorpha]|nr:hypothetical protein CIB48_g12305 [Xylaria polymorpha]